MRIRTVKPGIWTSEDMALLSDQALLLALGLLNFADDEGYFTANLALIRAAIFPLRKTGAVDALLAELVKIQYIELATGTDGRKYGRVCKFSEHQRINRGTKSPISPFWPPAGALTEPSVNPHGALTEPSLLEGNGKEEERKQEGKRSAIAEREARDIAFAIFWQDYPRKEDKAEARKAFDKVDVDISVLLQALERQKRSEGWTKEGGQFIPYGAKWLNKRRWEDEKTLPLLAIPPSVAAARDGRHLGNVAALTMTTAPDDV